MTFDLRFDIYALIVWSVYRFLIVPFNAMRLILGMKKKEKEFVLKTKPVRVFVDSFGLDHERLPDGESRQ